MVLQFPAAGKELGIGVAVFNKGCFTFSVLPAQGNEPRFVLIKIKIYFFFADTPLDADGAAET